MQFAPIEQRNVALYRSQFWPGQDRIPSLQVMNILLDLEFQLYIDYVLYRIARAFSSSAALDISMEACFHHGLKK